MAESGFSDREEIMEKRFLRDRRKSSTPALSRYTFIGRRERMRRRNDGRGGGYVDRYRPALFFFIVLILGLNILDAIFTMAILDRQGWEANPIVESVINLHGDRFWIWKFLLVSLCLSLLCLHSGFRRVHWIIVSLSSIYLFVVVYQALVLNLY
jgi:hypothetical protein